MYGASLSFLKEATIVINTLISSVVSALSYIYVQASNKLDSLRKALLTSENIHTPAAAVDAAMFSKITEPHSETMKACGSILYRLYVFTVVE